jgi:hypothetical protein
MKSRRKPLLVNDAKHACINKHADCHYAKPLLICHATIKELMEVASSVQSGPNLYSKDEKGR